MLYLVMFNGMAALRKLFPNEPAIRFWFTPIMPSLSIFGAEAFEVNDYILNYLISIKMHTLIIRIYSQATRK